MTSEALATPARLRDPRGALEFEPHRCFACGELNEHGLHLVLHASPDGAWAQLVLDRRFQGWESVAHGGIVCTILDEVMAWAVIGRGTWGVTTRLSVAFRRPVETGCEIRAEGWVVESNRRVARAKGRILDVATGVVLATGESSFVAVPPAQLERLKARYGMRRLADTTGDGASRQPRAGASAAGRPA